MEINKPNKGVFKGMGKLEENKFVNRKFFPNLRNQHQFQYTHNHRNDYRTSFQAFQKFDRKDYNYTRLKKSNNKSQFQLGRDFNTNPLSQNKAHYRKHQNSLPPKPFKQPQEGVGINQYEQRTGQKIDKYATTSKDAFSLSNKRQDGRLYKYTRSDRFNPITGQFKGYGTNFGFEDYLPKANKNYKACNYTVIPLRQKFDIITGRKLTHS